MVRFCRQQARKKLRIMDDISHMRVHRPRHAYRLMSDISESFCEQKSVDIILMCESHSIAVHKLVLAAISPYLERRIGDNTHVRLVNMKFSVLKSLVQFMYCGETTIPADDLSSLLEAGNFLKIKGLCTNSNETIVAPLFDDSRYIPLRPRRGRPPIYRSILDAMPDAMLQLRRGLAGGQRSDGIYQGNMPKRRGRKPGLVNQALRAAISRDLERREAAKEMQNKLNSGDPVEDHSFCAPRTKMDEEMIQTLKNATLKEAKKLLGSVVMLEIRNNRSVEKCVFSTGEVNLLESVKRKMRQAEYSSLGLNENATYFSELKLKLGFTKAKLQNLISRRNKEKIIHNKNGFAGWARSKEGNNVSTIGDNDCESHKKNMDYIHTLASYPGNELRSMLLEDNSYPMDVDNAGTVIDNGQKNITINGDTFTSFLGNEVRPQPFDDSWYPSEFQNGNILTDKSKMEKLWSLVHEEGKGGEEEQAILNLDNGSVERMGQSWTKTGIQDNQSFESIILDEKLTEATDDINVEELLENLGEIKDDEFDYVPCKESQNPLFEATEMAIQDMISQTSTPLMEMQYNIPGSSTSSATFTIC